MRGPNKYTHTVRKRRKDISSRHKVRREKQFMYSTGLSYIGFYAMRLQCNRGNRE